MKPQMTKAERRDFEWHMALRHLINNHAPSINGYSPFDLLKKCPLPRREKSDAPRHR